MSLAACLAPKKFEWFGGVAKCCGGSVVTFLGVLVIERKRRVGM